MIHLDTSYVVDLLRERRRAAKGPATALLDQIRSEPVELSVFVACELHVGVELSQASEREQAGLIELFRALSVAYPGRELPPLYASTLASLQRRGERIATMDLLIACMALSCGASLVTRNVRHFSRVPGLEILSY